jgi:molybdopterin synthase catalytic subunit
MIEITAEKIDVETIIGSVGAPEAGGIALFLGTTRNNSDGKKVQSLAYEAYVPMAIKMMGDIANEIHKRWNVHNVSIVHRVGDVPVSEASVVIAVSAAHRNAALESCRYAIDELKKRVPIWKKEIFENGAEWVENMEAKVQKDE